MVASDVGMEVFPSSFDPVVIGTVRREEVQLDPLTMRRCQRGLYLLGMVNRVVVQDNMDHFDIGVLLHLYSDNYFSGLTTIRIPG